MGYFDSVSTENVKDVKIGNTKIKGGYYQSKDFMYDGDERFWRGDDFIITQDGHIYFEDEDMKHIKITGLFDIYSYSRDTHKSYWLLVEQNKIIMAYEDAYYEELPKCVQHLYYAKYGDSATLNIDLDDPTSFPLKMKKTRRAIKKRKIEYRKKEKPAKLQQCAVVGTYLRKKRKGTAERTLFKICIEKQKMPIVLDEFGAYMMPAPIMDLMRKASVNTGRFNPVVVTQEHGSLTNEQKMVVAGLLPLKSEAEVIAVKMADMKK